MILFWLLILAHFIADFPLQSDKIFALKSRYKWGLLPHILISVLTSLIIASPFLRFRTFWIMALFLAGIHFLLDWLKIVVTKNFLNDSIIIFLLDQALHIFFIWLTCFYLFKIPLPEFKNKFLTNYFLNPKIICTLSGLVFSVFGGRVMIHYIQKIIYQIRTREAEATILFSDPNQREIGYVERFFSTLGIMLGGWFLFLVPCAFLPRFIVTNETDGRELMLVNLIAGLGISIGVGAVMQVFW